MDHPGLELVEGNWGGLGALCLLHSALCEETAGVHGCLSVGEEKGHMDESQKYIDSVICAWCNRSEPPLRLGSLLFASAPLAFPCGSPRYLAACVCWVLFVCFLLSLQAAVSSSRCTFL